MIFLLTAMNFSTRIALLSLSLIFAFSGVFAQPLITAGDRFEQVRLLENLLGDDLSPQVGQEEDRPTTDLLDDDAFGEQILLRRTPRTRPFRVFAEADGFFTNNAFITSEDRTSDRFTVLQAGMGWEKDWDRRFFADVGIRQQFYRYGENSALDFNLSLLNGGIGYLLPDEWLGIYLFSRYSLQSLTAARQDGDLDRFDEFLRIHTFTAGGQKIIPLNAFMFFNVGALGRLGITDQFSGPGFADPERNDLQAFFSFQHIYSRSLSWRAQYSINRVFYSNALVAPEQKRRDWNHSLVLSGTYDVRSWLAISLSTSYTINDSNGDFFDYEVANLGGSLRATARF